MLSEDGPKTQILVLAVAFHRFLRRCVNVQSVVDSSGIPLVLPESTKAVAIVSDKGSRLPAPLKALGLKKVIISAAPEIHLQIWDTSEPSYYQTKVKSLCHLFQRLDSLHLHLPGFNVIILAAADGNRFPLGSFRDPLPVTLKHVESLTIEIPCFTVAARSLRKPHWVSLSKRYTRHGRLTDQSLTTRSGGIPRMDHKYIDRVHAIAHPSELDA